MNLPGIGVLFYIFQAFGAGNGHNVFTLMQGPGDGYLCGRGLVFFADAINHFDQLQILFEIFTLVSGIVSPEIVLRNVVKTLYFTCEKSASDRTKRHQSDAQFLESGYDALFQTARPKRVLRLQSRYFEFLVGSTNSVGSDFG